MKKVLILISIVIFSVNAFAQSWPSSSATRPSFGGFGVATEDENSSVFESNGASFAGDYVSTLQTKDLGFGDDEKENESGLGNPGQEGDAPVPIIESIIGLLGLGGAYAIRLFSKKRKDEE